MNKTVSSGGAMQFRINHFEFDINALTNAINSLGKGLNPNTNDNNYIISGCNKTVVGSTVNINAGAIFYNGEVFQVDAQSITTDAETFDTRYYFDLLEQWDSNGLVPYLDGSVKNTRKIRKAQLVVSPINFTDALYGTMPRLNDDILNAISTVEDDLTVLESTVEDVQTYAESVQSNLDIHEAIGDNHNYLANHLFSGVSYDVELTPEDLTVSIDTGNSKYYSRYYMVGNLVFYEFNLPILISNPTLAKLTFSFPSTFPRGNGRSLDVFKTTSANLDDDGNLIDYSLLVPYYAHTNYPSGDVRQLVIARVGEAYVTSGGHNIIGQLVFKKITSDTGIPA